MSHYLKIILAAISLSLVPAGLFAQSDICSSLPTVERVGMGSTPEVIVEQMKERAEMQARQQKERAPWLAQMFTVKYLDSSDSLKALCIFSAEIVPQPGLHMISVRADRINMTAIGEAIKRLDVPQAGPRSVELTIHVLVASDQDETLRPVPTSLKAVIDQFKGVLTYKQFYLLDTLLSTTADAKDISLSGNVRGLNPSPQPGAAPRDNYYHFNTNLRIGSGETSNASVRLSGLRFALEGLNVSISTDLDVPQGKQVVVGKVTSGDRAYILVVSAKILN